jgi:undecaprenyl diphosphate synthase
MSIKHIGIIPDGNGRYGIKIAGKRTAGHSKGIDKIKEIIDESVNLKIHMLSIYVLSLDNVLKRDKDEIDQLLNYFNRFIDKNLNDFTKRGIKITSLGEKEVLDIKTKQTLKNLDQQKNDNPVMTINLLVAYSAIKYIQKNDVKNPNYFLPPLDLIIRTGSHHRLSDFLLYEAAYAEIYFLDCLWPEFTKDDFHLVLNTYDKSIKKFGAVV